MILAIVTVIVCFCISPMLGIAALILNLGILVLKQQMKTNELLAAANEPDHDIDEP